MLTTPSANSSPMHCWRSKRMAVTRSIRTGPELADRINDDIYTTSRAIGIPAGAFVADVVF